jgi:hypothetical protein
MLRGLGVFLMFIALRMVMGPLVAIVGIVPLFGSFFASIVAVGASIVAFGLSLTLSALVCSTAWFYYRPMISLALLAAALIPLYLLPRLRSGSAAAGVQRRVSRVPGQDD